MSVRKWAAVGVTLAAVVGLLGFVFGAWDEGSPSTGGESSAELPAADIAFETLEGGTASISDYRGKVVLLNFWGTWCPPCRKEIPELVTLQKALSAAGGSVIGVAVESGSPEEIRSFADKFEVNYPIWVSDAEKALSHYDAMGYPFTVLIDESGNIRREYLGPQTAAVWARDIEDLTGLSVSLEQVTTSPARANAAP